METQVKTIKITNIKNKQEEVEITIPFLLLSNLSINEIVKEIQIRKEFIFNKILLLNENEYEISSNKELIQSILDESPLYYEVIFENNSLYENPIDKSMFLIENEKETQILYDNPNLIDELLKKDFSDCLSYLNCLIKNGESIKNQIGVILSIESYETFEKMEKLQKQNTFLIKENSKKTVYITLINKGLLTLIDFSLVINEIEDKDKEKCLSEFKYQIKSPIDNKLILKSKEKITFIVEFSCGNIITETKKRFNIEILSKKKIHIEYESPSSYEIEVFIEKLDKVNDFLVNSTSNHEILSLSRERKEILYEIFSEGLCYLSVDEIYKRMVSKKWNLNEVLDEIYSNMN